MRNYRLWCAIALALITQLGMVRPAHAQCPPMLNPGWNLAEVQWLNDSETETGTGVTNFVLESWDPNDPPGGGATGYISAYATAACAGENGTDGSWASGFGEFYCRFIWGGPGTPATDDYYLDGFSFHTAATSAYAVSTDSQAFGWGWAGMGDPDTGSDAYITDSTSSGWNSTLNQTWIYNYHDGDMGWAAYMGGNIGGTLEGTYPTGGCVAEAVTDTYYEGGSAWSSATSEFAVTAEVVQADP